MMSKVKADDQTMKVIKKYVSKLMQAENEIVGSLRSTPEGTTNHDVVKLDLKKQKTELVKTMKEIEKTKEKK